MTSKLVGSVFGLAVFVGSPSLAVTQENVTGDWVIDMQTDAGSGPRKLSFQQDGETLTGTYTSDQMGEAELTGTVKGQVIDFSFSLDAGGQAADVRFSGTVDGDTMEGTIEMGGFGSGTFTGQRE